MSESVRSTVTSRITPASRAALLLEAIRRTRMTLGRLGELRLLDNPIDIEYKSAA
jgi:hypothetical protein